MWMMLAERLLHANLSPFLVDAGPWLAGAALIKYIEWIKYLR